MKLAVVFYRDKENPYNIPEEWPAEVKELPDDADVGPNRTEMSLEEYKNHIATHQASYDRWKSEVWEPMMERKRKYKRMMDLMQDLAEAYEMMKEEGEILGVESAAFLARYKKYTKKYMENRGDI